MMGIYNWSPQASGKSIGPMVAIRLEQIWERFHKKRSELPFTLPEEIPDPHQFFEGAYHQIAVNAYERNAHARKACIEHYGYACSVCGFDFQHTYGELGKYFIHVHHLIPISEIGAEYSVNPIEDLRPVCPNCHAMLHRSSSDT